MNSAKCLPMTNENLQDVIMMFNANYVYSYTILLLFHQDHAQRKTTASHILVVLFLARLCYYSVDSSYSGCKLVRLENAQFENIDEFSINLIKGHRYCPFVFKFDISVQDVKVCLLWCVYAIPAHKSFSCQLYLTVCFRTPKHLYS